MSILQRERELLSHLSAALASGVDVDPARDALRRFYSMVLGRAA